MTELRSKISYIGIVFMIMMNVFVLMVSVNKAWNILPIIMVILFINLFYWVFSFSGQYSVFIESDRLVIKNNLRLFFEKEIDLDQIKKVSRVKSTYYWNSY